MCGIAGYIGKTNIDEARVTRTLDLMKNRGPDCRDWVSFQEREGDINIVLLHSRLSIVDLDNRSNQPFTIDDCSLIFNGEIYNYLELRRTLKEKGVFFKTQSDTEVLLKSYLAYGENCVDKFEGMWSFAIYDRRRRKIFLSRDRFAEKPLYYLETPHGIYFGSEIKFIKALSTAQLSINYQHLKRYLVNGYKSLYKSKDTFFENIKELPHACNMLIDNGLSPKISSYWKPEFNPQSINIDQAIQGFRQRLFESIRLRLRADVPLAFCLSGGVDSGAIVSIAAKKFNYDVATFSLICSHEHYNERQNIEAIINDLGCKHTIIDFSEKGFIERLTRLIEYHDGPIATISYYIHSFISESVARQGYKVVCSGTGADELVTGYYDHFNLYLYETKESLQYQKYLSEWKNHTRPFVRNPHLKNPKLYFNNPSFREHIYLNNDEFKTFLKNDFNEDFAEEYYSGSLLRNRMMNEMFHEVIPVILHEDDLNSMYYSVENRSPYLDRHLFEFAYSIPSEYLIQNGYAKYILREAVAGILNDQVRLDRQKKGFNASLNTLVDFSEAQTREYLLDDGPIYDLIQKDKIEKLFDINPLPNSYSKFLFNFINTKLFLSMC